MAKKPESRRQARIKKALKREVGGKWFKVHGGPFQEAGIPDLLGCVEGLFFAFEVKEPDGEASELQLVTIAEYQAEGGIACLIETPEQAIAIVRAALASPEKRRFGRRLAGWICTVLRTAHGEDMGYGRRDRAPRSRRAAHRKPAQQHRKHVA